MHPAGRTTTRSSTSTRPSTCSRSAATVAKSAAYRARTSPRRQVSNRATDLSPFERMVPPSDNNGLHLVPQETPAAPAYARNSRNRHWGRQLWFRIRVEGKTYAQAWMEVFPESGASSKKTARDMCSRFLKWYEAAYPKTIEEAPLTCYGDLAAALPQPDEPVSLTASEALGCAARPWRPGLVECRAPVRVQSLCERAKRNEIA